MSLYKKREDMPCWMRLQVGTLAEREAEAARQGITEVWETKARRDWEEFKRRYRKQ